MLSVGETQWGVLPSYTLEPVFCFYKREGHGYLRMVGSLNCQRYLGQDFSKSQCFKEQTIFFVRSQIFLRVKQFQ